LFTEELTAKKFVIVDDQWDWEIQRTKIIEEKMHKEELDRVTKIKRRGAYETKNAFRRIEKIKR
jgi:hypothetical protein